MDKVNIAEKFTHFSDQWSPRIIGTLNDYHIKIVKVEGEFVWHKHDETDELFFIVKGQLLMKFRDRDVLLNEGEMIIVPKGVEHMPVAQEECYMMLIEPKETVNTGDVENDRTVDAQWI